MRFTLLDRILELEPGSRISALKHLSLAEEYLADHFPGFPVMPGVLMLEAMTEAGAWLVRVSEDFAHSVVTLKEAQNVRYGAFVEPGQTLVVEADIIKQDARHTSIKARGSVEGQPTVSARLILERYNLAEADADRAAVDAYVVEQLRGALRQLQHRMPVKNGATGAAPAGVSAQPT